MRVIGVQAAEAAAMTLSWRARAPIETATANTLADGIAARVPVAEALELMIHVVDDMVLVDEDEIMAGTAALSRALPVRIEPSVGAAWAAIRKGGPYDGPIGLIVTGGNVSGAEAAGLRS
jgi:threonine dehydratase